MWFKEHKKIIAGVITAVILVVLFAMGRQEGGIKAYLQSAAAWVSKPLASAGQGIEKGFRGIFRFKQVTAENEALQEEVDRLQQEKAQLQLERTEMEELEELRSVFHAEELEERELMAANVSALDYSNWQGVLTIDRGSEDGIKVGCGVVSGDGLVGKVIEVSPKSAKVASPLTEKNKISFQLSGEKKIMGVVESNGKNGLKGYLLEEGETAKKGDKLITSGIGSYPAGLKIGTITNVEKKKGTQTLMIEASPSVAFFSLRKVAVIL